MTDRSLYDEVAGIVDDHRFLNLLGVEVAEVSAGRVVLTLEYCEELSNPHSESLHGGVAATVLDHASAMAVYTAARVESGLHAGPTVDLRIAYVDPAVDDLTVAAEVVSLGDSVAFTSAAATNPGSDGSDRLVARSEGTFAIRSA